MKIRFLLFAFLLIACFSNCRKDSDEVIWSEEQVETETDGGESDSDGGEDGETDSDGGEGGETETDSDGGEDGETETDSDSEADSDSDADGSDVIVPLVDLSLYNQEEDIVKGSVAIYVFDESNQAIENAQVNLFGSTYSTDELGLLLVRDVDLNRAGSFYTVSKNGYYQGSRRFFPQEDAISYTQVQLISESSIGSFDAAAGGSVSGANGLSITFPENAIADQSGNAISGSVQVSATWLDPSDNSIVDRMPGNLQGVNRDIEEVSLASFSMMAVELEVNGAAVNLAEGKTAEIRFPIPSEYQSSAPQEIALWSFEDQEFGIWVEEGVATLSGNEYVATVSHFSFWNCDDPFTLVNVTGVLQTPEGVPIPNVHIAGKVLSNNNCASGFTNSQGIFSGPFPMNEEILLEFNSCGETIGAITVGPFSGPQDLGVLNYPNNMVPFTIIGEVLDCDNNPLSDAAVSIGWSGNGIYLHLENDNTFEYGFLACEQPGDVSVTAFNLNTYVQSETATIPAENQLDAGSIIVCGDSPDFYFVLTQNGTTTVFPQFGGSVDGQLYINASAANQSYLGFSCGEFDFQTGDVITFEGLGEVYSTDEFGISCNNFDPASTACSEFTFTLTESNPTHTYGETSILAGSISGMDIAGDPFEIDFRLEHQ